MRGRYDKKTDKSSRLHRVKLARATKKIAHTPHTMRDDFRVARNASAAAAVISAGDGLPLLTKRAKIDDSKSTGPVLAFYAARPTVYSGKRARCNDGEFA